MDAPTIPDLIPQDNLSTSQPTAAEYTPSGWIPVSGDAGQWHAVGSIAGPQPFETRTAWRRWLKRIGAPVWVPQLPEGWEWHDATDGTAAVCSARPDRYVFLFQIGLLDAFSAPPEVVLAVIAAHRARGGA